VKMKTIKLKIVRELSKIYKKFGSGSLCLPVVFIALLGLGVEMALFGKNSRNFFSAVWSIVMTIVFSALALFEAELELKKKYGSLRNRNKHRSDNSIIDYSNGGWN
jgi:hypothetical protein